ncbi:Hist deacetyl domain containing protein [Trichuris trichiura]|uniref:Hist deacetyl domain containing protein n=1 Tax=Trichuris trichiura TaxID=36087 RepID=A0A077ZG51_TRITR|nr:Hist deacetyl domain containing protein [Trichuris trichiura]
MLPGYLAKEGTHVHRCLWDSGHEECPKRLTVTINHCTKLGLLSRMKQLGIMPCTEDVLALFHSTNFVRKIALTERMSREELERFCDGYDSVYLRRESYQCALNACRAVVEATKTVITGKCAGCVALVKPRNHHAMKSESNGFCIFNNVGVAASYSLKHLGVKKILIIDWDVYYGQGVQHVFYNNSNVLCVSIHRHQQGTFWPYMREAEWNRTGSFEGEGFNVNLDDKDYLAVFRHIIVPIALEFQPDLVFVSAGFDAAVGCPLGNMRVSPQAFGYFMKMLMPIAGSRLVVALEGGYSVDSLKWSVRCVIRALLHDPLFQLSDINVPVTPSVVNAIHLVATALRIQWNCMSAFVGTITKCLLTMESRPFYVTVPKFIGGPDMAEEEGVSETPSSSNVAQMRSAISYLMAQTSKWQAEPRRPVLFEIVNEGSEKPLSASTFCSLSLKEELRSKILCTLTE